MGEPNSSAIAAKPAKAAGKSLPVAGKGGGGAPGPRPGTTAGVRAQQAAGGEPLWVKLARIATGLGFVAAVPVIVGLPIGRRLFWTVAVAILPLFFVTAGFYAWRRICPLALVGQIGRLVGKQSKRKVGDWLAANYPYVQFGVLVAALAARLVAVNGTPWALGGFLIALAVAALVVSFRYTGKTWCNYFCPVGIVEKFYTEPTLLNRKSDNSQCTSCTACKKHCPDIDLEAGYWKEASATARRTTYFAWPGVVLGFYTYYFLVAGHWGYYFSGDWTREDTQASQWLDAGFSFATFVPRIVAAPLTLAVFGAVSFGLFALGERAMRQRARRESARPEAVARLRHRALALAGFTAFVLFYLFAGQPTLANGPWWLKRGFEALVVGAGAAVLLRRWGREEQDYVQEKFARGILRRWEWGDEPPSEDLSDVYLIHTERTKQREARLRAYKDTVRDLVADGVLTRGEFALLDKLRAQLGVTDKDHEKVLSELTAEEKNLFDPKYRGSIEQRLQRDQYRRDLERVVLHAARQGRAADHEALEAVRQEHNVPDEEHHAAIHALRAKDGPIALKAREELAEIKRLRRALRRARDAGSAGASSQSVQFFAWLAAWRQKQHVDLVLSFLSLVSEPKVIVAAAEALRGRDPAKRDEAIAALAALSDDTVAELVSDLLDPECLSHPPPDADADAYALIGVAADVSPYMRAAAVYVLSRFDDSAARATVVDATADPHPVVRETAVRVLGARGRLTRELVQRAMEDKDARVYKAVMRAVAPSASAENLPAAGDAAADAAALAQTTMGVGTADPARYATLDSRAAVSTLTTLEEMMFLRNVPLFAALEPDDLEELTAIASERRYLPQMHLCREGEESDEVFIVVRGKVRAWIKAPDGSERILGESGDGSCIGEMAALDKAPRSASVTALAETRTLVLAGKEFKQLLGDRPAIAQGVLAVITSRMREMIVRQQRSG